MKMTRDLIYSNIDQIMINAQKVNTKSELTLKEILNDDFLSKETKFNNLQEIFYSLGKSDVTEDTFNEIPEEEWSEFIISNTPFQNWKEMLNEATAFYIKKHVFTGIL